MSNFSKTKYAYVTKSSNILSIIIGVIIIVYGLNIFNNFLGAIILGVGIGMTFFSVYELLYSKSIKENKDIISGVKIDNFDKYILVNKYNTPLSLLVGFSIAYIGISIGGGFAGMILFGFGVSALGNINRIIYGAERNPLF